MGKRRGGRSVVCLEDLCESRGVIGCRWGLPLMSWVYIRPQIDPLPLGD